MPETDFTIILKKRMEELQLSQKEFAELLGIAESALSRYLTGQKPNYDAVNQVSQALGLAFLAGEIQPHKTEMSSEEKLHACLLRDTRLSKKDIEQIIDFAEFLARRKPSKKKK